MELFLNIPSVILNVLESTTNTLRISLVSKNFNVSGDYIGSLMKNYVEEVRLVTTEANVFFQAVRLKMGR